MTTIVPVILSGGSGSRLWPVSRELYPKQLLTLVSQSTMLQETVLRLQGIDGIVQPVVVCNEDHRFMVSEQLRAIGATTASIILEPCGRNTAPAAAVAALNAVADGDDPLLLVLPADHVITNQEAFHHACKTAITYAQQGKLVTFGITPSTPETGYGYIQTGSEIAQPTNGSVAYTVASFVEKPDLETAQHYLASGTFLWNSGMFMFSAQRYLAELQLYAPDIASSCHEALTRGSKDQDFLRLNRESFAHCPSDSIDYAVMEKTADAVVVPLDAGWNDVGSWAALLQVGQKDGNGNLLKGDVLIEGVSNSYIAADHRLVAAVGVQDHIIVETADAVLVAHKDHVQDVKSIVNQLKAAGRHEAVLHRRVCRPWGSYESVDSDQRFQVKRITVNPGASLSLQMHHHRAEHWIVVKGTATVTKGDEVILLSENQSIYIPLGVTHRLENPGVIPLELIEVQSGSYLGEDDIVRFDDTYGRN